MTAPKELTTAPSGYEWTGEVREAKAGEIYGMWQNGQARWTASAPSVGGIEATVPILRRLKPATLMVELPRETVEWLAGSYGIGRVYQSAAPLHGACIAALESEDA